MLMQAEWGQMLRWEEWRQTPMRKVRPRTRRVRGSGEPRICAAANRGAVGGALGQGRTGKAAIPLLKGEFC